jgi:hypothetical protein
LGIARPASLVSAIATEVIWDTAKRFRMRVVIFYRLPNAHEAAIVAILSDTRPKRPSARTAASSSDGDTERFSAFDASAELIICNNKVLRPIRRFCSGVPALLAEFFRRVIAQHRSDQRFDLRPRTGTH